MGCIYFETPCIYQIPPTQAGYDIKSIFKRSKASLNSDPFSSKADCQTKAIYTSLSNYLAITEVRTDIFMNFSIALA